MTVIMEPELGRDLWRRTHQSGTVPFQGISRAISLDRSNRRTCVSTQTHERAHLYMQLNTHFGRLPVPIEGGECRYSTQRQVSNAEHVLACDETLFAFSERALDLHLKTCQKHVSRKVRL